MPLLISEMSILVHAYCVHGNVYICIVFGLRCIFRCILCTVISALYIVQCNVLCTMYCVNFTLRHARELVTKLNLTQPFESL